MAINILIVDDSEVMRNIITKTIFHSGINIGEIHQAGDGVEGLKMLQEYWIDLLFIDVNMPVMDGMEMLCRVREDPETRNTPILIVSTESNENRIKAFSKKKAGFIHKPFTPEVLKNKIEEMLGSYE